MSATPYFATFNTSNADFGLGVIIFPGAVIGKPPCAPAGRLAKPTAVTGKPCKIGAGSIIGCNAILYEGVTIGDGCLIGDGAIIREGVVIGDNTTIGMNTVIGPRVRIGCGTRVMELCQVGGDTVIGNDVFIAPGLRSAADNSMAREGVEVWSAPVIKNHARLGIGVCLLPSVVVGEDAVVGAGSVVTRNVDPGTMVMGRPARYWRTLHEHEKACSNYHAAGSTEPAAKPVA